MDGLVNVLANRLIPQPLVKQASIVLSALTWLVVGVTIFLGIISVFFVSILYREWNRTHHITSLPDDASLHSTSGAFVPVGPAESQSLGYFLAEKVVIALVSSVIAQIVARMVLDAQVWDSLSLRLLNMSQTRSASWLAWSDMARQYLFPIVVGLLVVTLAGLGGWLVVGGATTSITHIALLFAIAVFIITLTVLLFTRWAVRRVAMVESQNAFLYFADPANKASLTTNPITTLSLVIFGEPKVGKTSLLKALLDVNPADTRNPINEKFIVTRDVAAIPIKPEPVALPGHKDAVVLETTSKEPLRNSHIAWDIGILVARADQIPLDKDKELYRMLLNRCRTVRVVLSHISFIPRRAIQDARVEWQRVLNLTQLPFACEVTGYSNHERDEPEPWVKEGVADLRADIIATLKRDGTLWRSDKTRKILAEAASRIIAQAISTMVWPALISDQHLMDMTSLQAETELYQLYYPGELPNHLPPQLEAIRNRPRGGNGEEQPQMPSGQQFAVLVQRLFIPLIAFMTTRSALIHLISSAVSFVIPVQLLWSELFRLLQFTETCRDPTYTDQQHRSRMRRFMDNHLSVRTLIKDSATAFAQSATDTTPSVPGTPTASSSSSTAVAVAPSSLSKVTSGNASLPQMTEATRWLKDLTLQFLLSDLS